MQIMEFFMSLADFKGPILIIAGLISAISIFQWLAGRDKEEEWKTTIKLAAFIGFFVGIISLIVGGTVWSMGVADWITIALFIIVGLALCLGPIKKLPLAGIAALAIGSLVAAFVSGFFGSIKIVAAVFVIIFILVFVFAKAIETILDGIGTVLSFPLVSIPLGLICIVQGVLLLLGTSLAALF
ncbi:MAG: hypothetical protein ACFFBS_02745 [Promethearchaeota archaeon]